MKFNNVQNKEVTLDTGEKVWLSRSMAVCAIVSVIMDREEYVLISKRGKGTPNFQGKYNLVCGYLDNNETLLEACCREVWEETGVDISEYRINRRSIYDNGCVRPLYIDDVDFDGRQNVTFRYLFCKCVDELPATTNENSEPNEVDDIKWIKLADVDKYEFAFNHKYIIKSYF